MSKTLECLDSEFRIHHFVFVDIIKNEETVMREHEILDNHDNEMVMLASRN